jgi:hypothetical protein
MQPQLNYDWFKRKKSGKNNDIEGSGVHDSQSLCVQKQFFIKTNHIWTDLMALYKLESWYFYHFRIPIQLIFDEFEPKPAQPKICQTFRPKQVDFQMIRVEFSYSREKSTILGGKFKEHYTCTGLH